jgi:hypothetical protein
MRTTIITAAATLTTNYNDNRKVVEVYPGPLAFGLNYTKASSTSLDLRIEFGWPSIAGVVPVVTDDTLWYPPATHVGVADNTLAVTTTGRSFIDLSGRLPTTTAGQIGFAGYVPGGVTHVRISVKLTGTLTAAAAAVTLFHNGPAHAVSAAV